MFPLLSCVCFDHVSIMDDEGRNSSLLFTPYSLTVCLTTQSDKKIALT